MQVADTGGEEEELDMLQSGESEGVHRLDGIVVDDEHGDVLRASKGVAGYRVDPVITLHKSLLPVHKISTDLCLRLSLGLPGRSD